MHKIHCFFPTVFAQRVISWPWFSDTSLQSVCEFWLKFWSWTYMCPQKIILGLYWGWSCWLQLQGSSETPSHTWTGPPGIILFYLKSAEVLGHSWLPKETCYISWQGSLAILLEETHLSFKIPLPSQYLTTQERKILRCIRQNWKVSLDKSSIFFFLVQWDDCEIYGSINSSFQAMENVTLEILSFRKTQEVTKY